MNRRAFLRLFTFFLGIFTILPRKLFASASLSDAPVAPYGVPITTPTKVVQPDSYPPTRARAFTILQTQVASLRFLLPNRSKKFRTQVWGYNGLVPGQPFRAPANQKIMLSLDNQLPEPTFLDFSGVDSLVPARPPSPLMPVIPPGKRQSLSFTPTFAGTYIYRSGFNILEQNARGLSGTVIVPDSHFIADADHLLVYQDWSLDERNQLSPSMLHPASYVDQGFIGSFMTVNARLSNTFTFEKNARIRLRLVNLCLASPITLLFNELYGYIVAFDACPLPVPIILGKSLTIAPSQRVDLLLDMYFYAQGTIFVDGFGTFGTVDFTYRRRRLRQDLLDIQQNPLTPRSMPILDTNAPITSITIGTSPSVARALQDDYKRYTKEILALDLDEEMPNPAPYAPRFKRSGLHTNIPAYFTFNGVHPDIALPLFTWTLGQTVLLRLDNPNSFILTVSVENHLSQIFAENDALLPLPYFRDTHSIAPKSSIIIGFFPSSLGSFCLRSGNVGHTALGFLMPFSIVS